MTNLISVCTGSGYKYVSNEYPTTLVKSTFMCCFFSPPSTCLLNLAVCEYTLVKTKPKKQKQNLHARARKDLLQLSSLTEGRHVTCSLPLAGLTYTHTHQHATFTFVSRCMRSSAKASLASGVLQILILMRLDS